jgi:hypothetical protein
MPRIVHFEIPVDDPDRAIQFYTNIFGWEIKKWDGPMDYWMVMTGSPDEPGIDGGMFKREEPMGHINTVEVEVLSEYIEKITAHGGKAVGPQMTIPGVGYIAYFTDTEGGVFGVFQKDTNATAETTT